MIAKVSNRKSGQLILPGEKLGVIEEFVPDTWAYVKEGTIFSSVIGRALLDLMNKQLSIYPVVTKRKVPKVGDVVLGQISNVTSENAIVKIFKIEDTILAGFFSGILHVSDVRLSYVDSMFNMFKIEDILRAEIISEKNQIYHLSTKQKNLGVVYAFCAKCGHLLNIKRRDLNCSKCGNVEKRKTTLDYGKGPI